MLTNYFKVAWRHLLRSKGLSFINIFGLATGMAFAILIGLWIQFETSFDKFHVNREQVGLIYKHIFFNNVRGTQIATPLPIYYELAKYPEVKRNSRLSWSNEVIVSVGDKKLKKVSRYVDPEFFEMFTFPITKGNRQTALNDPYSIIVSESLATALFGNEDPIGKTIKLNNEDVVKISAVMKDIPKNSTLQFDFAGPFEYLMQKNQFFRDNKDNWGNNFMMNTVELKEGVSMEQFSKKIENLNVEKDKTLKDMKLFVHPVSKWNLYSEFKDWSNEGGKIRYVRLFGIVGLFVLLIACINFMNLATARSEKRAKEVGIRKAIGSSRKQLIGQFLAETMLTAFIAFIFALIIIPLMLPLLKDIGFQNVVFDFTNYKLLLSMLAVALLTGLIAGSYPALYLSSFMPVRVLKGLFKQGVGAVVFRKVLVVSQFTISVGLIISTVIVFQQIKHAQDRSLGYDPNNLVSIYGNGELIKNFVPLKDELLKTGHLQSVARSSSPLTAIYNSWSDFTWTGKDPNAQLALDVIMIEWDFEKTADFKFKMGRPLSPEFRTDSNAALLNEAALKMIGYKDPIGKIIKSGDRDLTIVGIIEDMVITNPFQPVNPTIIFFDAPSANNNIYLRLKPDAAIKETIADIQPIFEKYSPSTPFEYFFSDEEFAKKFGMENQVAKLAAIFSGLAIFISCLGLFGLAAFMAERRTKEIGIRKVLGASLLHLWSLMSREFVWMVLIGSLIASPIAYWLMSDWLQGYEYRISISWIIFVAAAIIAMIIAIVTVSTQAVKAAIANPVNSLRSE